MEKNIATAKKSARAALAALAAPVVIAFLAASAAFAASAGPSPEEVFRNPPDEAHAGVWWHWMGSQVTKEGIVKDLDWFVRMGISSATIFGMADSCTPWAKRIAGVPAGGMRPYDDKWWELVAFACREGAKRGIDMGLHNCPGYTSTGGRWIPPRLAMRELVFGVKDPAKDISAEPHSPFPVYDEAAGTFRKPPCEARRTDYVRIGNVRGIEVGHVPTGSYVQPADWDSFGLECDKMKVEAVSFHLDTVIAEWKKHLGSDLRAAGLRHVLLDSYEAGTPTWTPKMREEFLKRRGYDCLEYLPILGGHANLYTAAECKKFKADFDRTVKDLYRDVLFKTMHEKLAVEGLRFSCEPYSGPWSVREVSQYIDRIMTEFWHRPGKGVSLAGYGSDYSRFRSPGGGVHNIVEAEAFTSADRWTETPAALKATGDLAWCKGVNRFVLHSCVHQPWGDDVKPGVTMGRWGTHFGRNQTWAESGKAWFDYVARSQALLQWGVPSSARLPLKFAQTARTDGERTLYFIVNNSNATAPLALHGGGIWFDAVPGTVGAPPAALAPRQSGFWLPADGAVSAAPAVPATAPADADFAEIVGWTPTLGDWTQSPDPATRDFSGTVAYRATFDFPAAAQGRGAVIDLGKVMCATAVVKVGGKEVATVWCAPWRTEIPAALLKPEGNVLEIAVANTWRNRLIADEREPPDVEFSKAPYPGGDMMLSYPAWFGGGLASRPSKGRKCFATWNYFTPAEKDGAPMPSGLAGPVRIAPSRR